MESIYFWIILAILILMFFGGTVLFIYSIYMGRMLVKIADLLEEVRGVAAEVRYIQMARIRRRSPDEPPGLMELDGSHLSYDPLTLPPNQGNL